MDYYHGSKNSNIKVLKADHSVDGKVYVTTNKLAALVYASREYVNLFVMNKETGIVKFLEYKHNLFETLYKGKFILSKIKNMRKLNKVVNVLC